MDDTQHFAAVFAVFLAGAIAGAIGALITLSTILLWLGS